MAIRFEIFIGGSLSKEEFRLNTSQHVIEIEKIFYGNGDMQNIITLDDEYHHIRMKVTTFVSSSTKKESNTIVEISTDGVNWEKAGGEISFENWSGTIMLGNSTVYQQEFPEMTKCYPTHQSYQQVCDMFCMIYHRSPSFFEVLQFAKEQNVTIIEDHESLDFKWGW